MSICDEGWDSYPKRIGEKQFCPAAIKVFDEVDSICGCGLFVWHEWQPLPWKDKKPPDTCPYAPILKLLAEATDIDDLKVEQHIPQSYGDPVSDKWSVVTFWMRR